MNKIIKPRKPVLLRNAAIWVIVGVVLAYLLRDVAANALANRLLGNALLGISPYAVLAFVSTVASACVGLAGDWRHEITVGDAALTIKTRQGRTRVDYDNIADIKRCDSLGVGIVLHNVDLWLATFEGKASEIKVVRRLHQTWRRFKKVDIVIDGKYIDCSWDELIEDVKNRMAAGDASGPPPVVVTPQP